MSALAVFAGGVFATGVWASGVRLAVPTLLASLGDVFSERSGVLNLGIEGMMMVGAFGGFAVAATTGSAGLGLLAGAGAGAGLALVMAYGAVVRHANVVVTGFALVLLGQGLANFLYAQTQDSLETFQPLPEVDLGVLSRLPFVGQVLFRQNVLAYVAVGLVVLVWLVLRYTRFGLELDASGSDPAAAAAKGVDVARTRAAAVLLAGAFAGLGGAAITVGAVGNFGHNITAGKGFVAIALVALARNRVWLAAVAAYGFGVLEALQTRLQGIDGVPIDLLPALPWVAVVAALVAAAYFRIVRREPAYNRARRGRRPASPRPEAP